MEGNIYINLDCGAELEITRIGERFQLLEIIPNPQGWRKQKTRAIGGLHSTVFGALEEVRTFALAQYEILALDEIASAVQSTNTAIKDYFDAHSEYLAQSM